MNNLERKNLNLLDELVDSMNNYMMMALEQDVIPLSLLDNLCSLLHIIDQAMNIEEVVARIHVNSCKLIGDLILHIHYSTHQTNSPFFQLSTDLIRRWAIRITVMRCFTSSVYP